MKKNNQTTPTYTISEVSFDRNTSRNSAYEETTLRPYSIQCSVSTDERGNTCNDSSTQVVQALDLYAALGMWTKSDTSEVDNLGTPGLYNDSRGWGNSLCYTSLPEVLVSEDNERATRMWLTMSVGRAAVHLNNELPLPTAEEMISAFADRKVAQKLYVKYAVAA